MIDLDTKIFIRIILRYLLMVLSFSGVSLIIWYFIGAFTQNIKLRLPITIIIVILCAYWYVVTHRIAW